MAGNEASAIGSLRAINSSQQAFASACSNGMYAADLTVLGTPPTSGGAAFISPDLSAGATVTKSGFDVTMAGTAAPNTTPDNCQGETAGANQVVGYYASATAQSASTGSRNFWTNTSGTVYNMPEPDGAFQSTDEVGAPTGDATAAPIQ
jgi:hypothetical protein